MLGSRVLKLSSIAVTVKVKSNLAVAFRATARVQGNLITLHGRVELKVRLMVSLPHSQRRDEKRRGHHL